MPLHLLGGRSWRAIAFAAAVTAALVFVPHTFSPAPTLIWLYTRVSTPEFFPSDPSAAASGPPAVLQQNEPSIAVHPLIPNLIAVGMNDVRTLSVSNDAWQGLAVSTNGGTSFDYEALVPGYPGDTSAAGLASPVHGNA